MLPSDILLIFKVTFLTQVLLFSKCCKIAEALHLFPAQSYKLSLSLALTVTTSVIHHAKPSPYCTACISLKGDKA